MENTDVLITVIGAVFTIVSPLVIAWRKHPGWTTVVKVGLPILVSLVIAVAYLLSTGEMEGLNILGAFLIVYGLQQLVYSTILKNLAGLLENETGPTDVEANAGDDTWVDEDAEEPADPAIV